jgi:autotransporter-associated beta strand protein
VGASFTIGGGAINNLTLNGGVNLTAGTTTTRIITVTSTGSTTLAGIITNGGFRKAGTGILTLSGANTYAGGTRLIAGTLAAGNNLALGTGGLTIDGGTLQSSGGAHTLANAVTVGGDFTIGGTDDLTLSGNVGIAAVRTLTVSNTAATTLSGVISGAGGFNINNTGGGSLTLSGANTYSGGTTLTAGTVAVGNNSALGTGGLTMGGGTLQAGGTGARTLANAATLTADSTITGVTTNDLTLNNTINLNANLLTVNGAGNVTLSNAISGIGGITKAGTSTLTLSGANTYSGTTTLTAGTVIAGTDTALGTGTLTMGGGTLQAGGAGARTLANAVTLTASSTITGVTSNFLTLSNTIGLGDSILTVNGAGNVTLSNTISGTGGLTMAGTGILTLTLANAYTGPTTVATGGFLTATAGLTNSSTMIVDGTITGSVTNNTIGTLSGTGTIVGALTNNGNLNPGNSPGTLNVVGGPFTNAPGSTLTVEIASPTSYDKVNVTGAPGTAIITGSTLAPRLLGGYLPKNNQVFPNIIEATGGVTGTFTIANERISRTLYWQALYNANSVDLQAKSNYTFTDLNLTRNQLSVGNMLNGFSEVTSGDMFTVLNAINALTTNESVQSAYNEISAQKYAALPTLSFPVTNMQFQYLRNRMARLRWEADLGRGSVSAGGGGLMKGFNFGYEDKMYLASSSFTLSDAGAPLIHQGMEQRWGIYLEPMANWGKLRPTLQQVGYRYKNFGFILGADYWIRDNFLVGLNTGYSHTATGVGGTRGDINANLIPFNAYSSIFVKGFYVNSTLGYTYNHFNLQRNIEFGTINRTAKANTSGHQFQAAAETGYDIQVGKAIIGPTVSMQFAVLNIRPFTESNADALNLRVCSQTANSLQTGVGARGSCQAKVGNVTVKPQVSVVWQHEYSNTTRDLNARLAQGSSPMNFRTDTPGRDFAVVNADISAKISKNLVANVSYNTEVGRSRSSNQGVNLGLRFEF